LIKRKVHYKQWLTATTTKRVQKKKGKFLKLCLGVGRVIFGVSVLSLGSSILSLRVSIFGLSSSILGFGVYILCLRGSLFTFGF